MPRAFARARAEGKGQNRALLSRRGVCWRSVHKGRLEAFSDGVIAILITIMVLELKLPNGSDAKAFAEILPRLCARYGS